MVRPNAAFLNEMMLMVNNVGVAATGFTMRSNGWLDAWSDGHRKVLILAIRLFTPLAKLAKFG